MILLGMSVRVFNLSSSRLACSTEQDSGHPQLRRETLPQKKKVHDIFKLIWESPFFCYTFKAGFRVILVDLELTFHPADPDPAAIPLLQPPEY